MANAKDSGEFHEFATVDTEPGSGGFATNPVTVGEMVNDGVDECFLHASGAAGSTVTLQFKRINATEWTDHNSTFTSPFLQQIQIGTGGRKRAGDARSAQYRAIIKEGDYSSGSPAEAVTFGIDW